MGQGQDGAERGARKARRARPGREAAPHQAPTQQTPAAHHDLPGREFDSRLQAGQLEWTGKVWWRIIEGNRSQGTGNRVATEGPLESERPFVVPCSLFPVPCSLFPVPCSLFPVPCYA